MRATQSRGSDAFSGRWSQTPIPSRAFASSLIEWKKQAFMYIGFGTLVVILVIVMIIYFIRRA